jgi:hypothetical protein
MYSYFIVPLFAFSIGYISASEPTDESVKMSVRRSSRDKSLYIIIFQNKNQIKNQIDLYFEDKNPHCVKTPHNAPQQSISFGGIKGKEPKLFEKINNIKKPSEQFLGDLEKKLLTQKENKELYGQLSQIFKDLLALNFMFSWSVKPQVKNMEAIEGLKLEYPEGTTVLALKKMIYDKLAESYPNNAIVKDRMYNIVIRLNGLNDKMPPDDFKMPDINKDKKPLGSLRNDIQLEKTTLESKRTDENKIIFNFTKPPSISIDGKPLERSFSMILTAVSNGIKINVSVDGKEAFPVATSNQADVERFSKYNQADTQNDQLIFFRSMFAKWANLVEKKVTFQGMTLTVIPSEPISLTFPKSSVDIKSTPPKPTSWFSPFSAGWQKIKSLFSSTKSRVVTALTVLGIIGAGTAVYKNWLPGFPGVKFTSTPRTPQQTPMMPNR